MSHILNLMVWYPPPPGEDVVEYSFMSEPVNADFSTLSDILGAAFSPKKKECPAAKMLKSVSPEVKTMIERLMANEEISTRKIHLALSRSGASIGRDSLADHRNNRCICGGTQ